MSRIHRRLAPSYAALIAAAALCSPAFAATTTVTVPAGTTQTSAITASPAAGDTIIVDIEGTLSGFSPTSVTPLVVQGSGAGAVNIIVDGRMQGRLNVPSATGPVSVTVNSGDDAATEGWHVGGTTTFGSGADVINNTAAGTIALMGTAFGTTTLNFNEGSDTLNNAGRLIVGRLAPDSSSFFWDATVALTNLETFNNSGLIVMGSYFSEAGDDGGLTDGQVNDRLLANGVAFTGSGDSRIVFDVYLGGTSKADCSTATIADCVDFTGGSTAGSTLVTISNARLSSDQPGLGAGRFNEGIILIVGSSAAGHFSLDPSMPGYVQTSSGGGLEVGLVTYQLAYDSVGKRHRLVSALPSTAGAQAVAVTGGAQEIWSETTGDWFGRQADLRANPEGLESSNGLWGRIATSASDRDMEINATNGGATRDYRLSSDQRTSQLVFGADMVRGAAAGGSWVLGLMLGAVRADATHDVTDSELIYTGVTGGVYSSYLAGPLFVDVVLNANVLDVEADVVGLGLNPLDKLSSSIKTLGGQIEAGYRLPVATNLSLEPLLSVSYATTRLTDMEAGAPDIYFEFQTAKSLRTGVGLRGAYDAQLMGLDAAFSLTGRYWQENEGEDATRLIMPTGQASIATELPGSFGEVEAGLNLYRSDGGLSGFVNVGGKFGDDYQAVSGSAGVRLRW